MTSITVRHADNIDSRDVFEWRNDPISVEMSHKPNVVNWQDHSRWFKDSLKNSNRVILICEDVISKEKIGVVRFDIVDNESTVSINLAPNMRGKNFSVICLTKSINFFSNIAPKIKKDNATIKTSNIRSQKAVAKAGFMFRIKEGDTEFYTYET